MTIVKCNYKFTNKIKLVLITALMAGLVSHAEARNKNTDGPVEREADCHRDKLCLDEYAKHKSEWMSCLDSAGISEKKRRKLSAKVEAMGIRAMKRQEILSFNGKRKECNNSFMKNLSEIHVKKEMVKTSPTTPPATPDLTEKKEKP